MADDHDEPSTPEGQGEATDSCEEIVNLVYRNMLEDLDSEQLLRAVAMYAECPDMGHATFRSARRELLRRLDTRGDQVTKLRNALNSLLDAIDANALADSSAKNCPEYRHAQGVLDQIDGGGEVRVHLRADEELPDDVARALHDAVEDLQGGTDGERRQYSGDVDMTRLLCEEVNTSPLGGECPWHGGDACLVMYYHADHDRVRDAHPAPDEDEGDGDAT